MLKPRLPLLRTAMCVLLGGVLAQLAGAFVSELCRTLMRLHGTPSTASGPSPWVVVPAMAASAATLIAVATLVPALAGLDVRQTLGLRCAKPSSFVAAAVGTVMLGPTADVMMRTLHNLWPTLNMGVVPMLHGLVQQVPVALAMVSFALLPGVSEELLFRGLLQGSAPAGVIGILISGVAFSLFHIDPQHIIGVLPLGLFLAWVGSRCGTWVTLAAHVANNSASIAAIHSDTFDVGFGTDAPLPWPWIPVSLVLVAISAWVIVQDTPPAAPNGTTHHDDEGSGAA